MIRFITNQKAQVTLGEYLVVFSLIVGMSTAMTIYFKRVLQARTLDARDYMLKDVAERTQTHYDGSLYKEYEPYYLDTTSIVDRTANTHSALGALGRFEQTVNEITTVTTKSETAPPKDADSPSFVVE